MNVAEDPVTGAVPEGALSLPRVPAVDQKTAMQQMQEISAAVNSIASRFSVDSATAATMLQIAIARDPDFVNKYSAETAKLQEEQQARAAAAPPSVHFRRNRGK